MRAIYYKEHGDIDVLVEGDWPEPKAGPGQVVVQVDHIGLNPLDYRLRQGQLHLLTGFQGRRLTGSDFCGRVHALGADVDEYQVGDAVYGMVDQLRRGTSADRITVSTKHLYHKPEGLDSEVAAGVPLAAMTALQALRDLAGVKANDTVLINGASGGVGHFAVQIAAYYGCRVTAVTSGRNADWMPTLGAAEVIDYTQEEFVDRRGQYQVIFDCYGNRPYGRCRKALTPTGTYVTTIPALGPAVQLLLNPLRAQKAKVVVVKSRCRDLKFIHGLIEDGHVTPVLDQTFSREQIHDAYRQLESKRTRGKMTVCMAQQE